MGDDFIYRLQEQRNWYYERFEASKRQYTMTKWWQWRKRKFALSNALSWLSGYTLLILKQYEYERQLWVTIDPPSTTNKTT